MHGALSMPDSRAVLNEYGFRGMSKVKSHAHLWDPFLRTPKSAPHKIPWPIDSPSQESHRDRSYRVLIVVENNALSASGKRLKLGRGG